ncbi:scn4ab, partial [Symbiodinium natans]
LVTARSTPVQVMQYTYTLFFLIELVLRIGAYGRSFFCGADWAWGWLDFLIVTSSLWELGIDVAFLIQQDDQLQGIGNSSALRAVRIIRITRMLKTLRLLRIFRFIVALRTLVTSIISTLKNLFWALMLLGIIIYAFAILFCQAVRSHVSDPTMTPLPEE